MTTDIPDDAEEEIATVSSAVVAKGQICAAGKGGKTSCVPSGGNAATAWSGALAGCTGSCTAPYDMWPEFPAGMRFSDAIRNKEAITQLLADVDIILNYAKANLGAEAYEGVLSGKLASVVSRIKNDQATALSNPDPRASGPLDTFESSLRAEQAAVVGPLSGQLASDKRSAKAVTDILKSVQGLLAQPKADYSAMVKRFNAYKATEAQVIDDLTTFATRASAATLTTLPQVALDVVAYSSKTSVDPTGIATDATSISTAMAQIEANYRSQIEPYQAFITAKLGKAPDISLNAQRSLANMVAYCLARRTQTDAYIADLLDGISARRDALIDAAATAAIRDTLKTSAFQKASSDFVDQATASNTAISTVPPKTTKYGYTLWADRFDQYMEVLQLEPLCSSSQSTTRPTWRDAGCIAYSKMFSRARTYTTSTIPQLVHLTLAQFRSKGVADSLLTEIDSLLTAGRTREAVLRYDAVARLTEGM